MVIIIHRHFAALAHLVTFVRTGLLHRHFWSSLLNCSQLVFMQNWYSPSPLQVVTSQLLPPGLLVELVFSIVTPGRHFSTPPNWSALLAVNIVTELFFGNIDFHKLNSNSSKFQTTLSLELYFPVITITY